MTSLSNSFPTYYGNLPGQADFYGAQSLGPLGMQSLPHLNTELDKKKRQNEYSNGSNSSSFAGKLNLLSFFL